jgi:hypothetical protein
LLHKSGNFRYSGANGTKFSENEFYGLKIGAIHRNRFAARVLELLEMAALPDLSAAIEPLLRVREGMRTERKALDRTLAAAARRSDIQRGQARWCRWWWAPTSWSAICCCSGDRLA